MENKDLELTMKIENDIFDLTNVENLVVSEVLEAAEEVSETITEETAVDITEVGTFEVVSEEIPTFDETIILNEVEAKEVTPEAETEEPTNWFFISAILFGMMAGIAIITACFTYIFAQ